MQSVHSSCIDSMYVDIGGLVVWYLKRWPGFDFEPELVLSIVNSYQLIIYGVFLFLLKYLYIRYKFSYGMSVQEIFSAILYKFCNVSPIFSIF